MMEKVTKQLDRVDKPVREWTGNNDNPASAYWILVPLAQSPITIRLNWMTHTNARAVHVGDYKIDLKACLKAGLVYIPENNPGYVRLRFQYSDGGVIELSRRRAGPSIEIGRVNF